MPIPIRIIPLHPAPIELISSTVHPLQSIFHTSVTIEPVLKSIIDAVLDDSRGQYNSTHIIAALLHRYSETNTKVLGITSVDLFVPILTYVFGEAQLDGPVGVVSTYRLDDTLYGLPADPAQFFERTLKEMVHELGHTYGLYHCPNFDCAMHSSTTAEDIDQKGAQLCTNCQKLIGIVH